MDVNWFVEQCARLSNLDALPKSAHLGDVCKYQNKYWVYEIDEWLPLEDAMRKIYHVKPLSE